MLRANSTIDAQSSLTQLLGQEHSSYLDQRQTASPWNVHTQHPANYPTHYQHPSLQGDNSTSVSASTSPDPAQSDSSAQHHTSVSASTSPNPAQNDSSTQHHSAIEGTGLQGKLLRPFNKKRCGRGATGMPRGRPPGAKNKPKGPDHGLPKVAKKKGRPLGAKNKYPRGTPMAPPPWALNNSRPTESGSSQTPIPTTAAAPTLVTPPPPRPAAQTPPDARANYTAPNGYAPVTPFSVTIDDDDRGFDHETGEWYSIRARAREQGGDMEIDQTLEQAILGLAGSSSSTSTPPEDFMTPMAIPYPGPNNLVPASVAAATEEPWDERSGYMESESVGFGRGLPVNVGRTWKTDFPRWGTD